MAKFLFFLVVLVLFSPFTHQKKTLCPKQHNTTKTPSSSSSSSSPGGIFILSTGNEGSGTTSTARLLIHDWGIGIPTNWGTKELDPEIRSRHCPLSQGLINTFNTITSELWQAKLQNVYYRKKREKLIKQAARTIRMIAQTTQTKRIIYHRSMPFQNPTTSPHLEDLPLIARQIGKNWSAALVLTLRDMPSAWLSHAKPETSGPFTAKIESLLQANQTSEGKESGIDDLPVIFLRYRNLHCEEKEIVLNELRPLLSLGFSLERLITSPELSEQNLLLHNSSKSRKPKYLERKEKLTQLWKEKESRKFPRFDAFTNSSCTI